MPHFFQNFSGMNVIKEIFGSGGLLKILKRLKS